MLMYTRNIKQIRYLQRCCTLLHRVHVLQAVLAVQLSARVDPIWKKSRMAKQSSSRVDNLILTRALNHW